MEEMHGALERTYRRIMLLVGRGRVKTGKDDGAAQIQQVRLGHFETFDNMPRLGEYGFNSMPPAETDAILLFVGGNRTDGVIIATSHQTFRMRNLKPGEVSISDDRGQSVFLTQSGIIVNGGGLPVTITNTPDITLDAPMVHATGDMDIGGNLTLGGNATAQGDISDQGSKSMAAMRNTYNGHGHPVASQPPIQKQ